MRAIPDGEFGHVRKAASQREKSVKSKEACCVMILLKCQHPSWRRIQAIQMKEGRLKCHVAWLRATALPNMLFNSGYPSPRFKLFMYLVKSKQGHGSARRNGFTVSLQEHPLGLNTSHPTSFLENSLLVLSQATIKPTPASE